MNIHQQEQLRIQYRHWVMKERQGSAYWSIPRAESSHLIARYLRLLNVYEYDYEMGSAFQDLVSALNVEVEEERDYEYEADCAYINQCKRTGRIY